MKLCRNMNWVYETTMSVTECFTILLSLSQLPATDDYESISFDCIKLSDTQLYLIYKGLRYFGKMRKTEYILTFSIRGESTIIVLQFHHELFGLPPMTPISEIDAFLKDSIQAFRIK